MKHNAKSIRPFIGARDFQVSRSFYTDLGFNETVLTSGFSYFSSDHFGFYLQDAHVKDWIDNTMVFLEVENVKQFWQDLVDLNLADKYKGVRLVPIREHHWGREFLLHDPSGILWHFGEFLSSN